MKEELARLKITVKEIRAQCVNDIRKRDTEMQRLKKHLEGRRGANSNPHVSVVVITSGKNSKDARPFQPQTLPLNSEGEASAGEPINPSYSLKEETTEFLTQLSQNLSDENDQLIHLIQSTLTTLRSLQGLPEPASHQSSHPTDNVLVSLPPSYDDLSTSTNDVLSQLHSLLTNPSFVPLEEVEIREDEILRLREGWERMATRWKDAVALMDGWRKRMLDEGDGGSGGTVRVNLDDLTQGLRLDVGMLLEENPSRGGDTAEEMKKGDFCANAGNEDDEEQLSHEMLLIEAEDDKTPRGMDGSPAAPSFDDTCSEPSFTAPQVAPRGALRRRSGNARTFPPPRKVSLSMLTDGNAVDGMSPEDRVVRKAKVRRTPRRNSPGGAAAATTTTIPSSSSSSPSQVSQNPSLPHPQNDPHNNRPFTYKPKFVLIY